MRVISRLFLFGTFLVGTLVACSGHHTTTPTAMTSSPAPRVAVSPPPPHIISQTPKRELCPDEGRSCPPRGSCCRAFENEYGAEVPIDVCNGPYALCVGAECVINQDGVSAKCRCPVYDGVSEAFPLRLYSDQTVPGLMIPSYFSFVNPPSDMKCTVPPGKVRQYARCGGALCSFSPEDDPTVAYCECSIITAGPNEEFCSKACDPLPGGRLRLGSARRNPITGKVECQTVPEEKENRCNLQRESNERFPEH